MRYMRFRILSGNSGHYKTIAVVYKSINYVYEKVYIFVLRACFAQ